MKLYWRAATKDRSGNAAILFAVSLPVLVGFAGLGVESGYWYFEQRRLQASADLAAHAGATIASAGGGASAIQQTARDEAERHGFRPSAGAIVINSPPLSGPNQNNRSVEVLVEQDYARTFSALFISEPVSMNVRAVASYQQEVPACVLALHRSRNNAMWFTGSANATFTGCDLMSNSVADDSVNIQGSVHLTASCVNSAGKVVNEANLTLEKCPGVRENIAQALDPFAHLPAPEQPDECKSVPGGPGAKTLSPGTYCGGMQLSGDVKLEPGEYIVSGGTLRINSNSLVKGDGVTFFLTDGANLHMNGTATVDLSAPTSGTYSGILFYGDRHSDGGDAILNGTANSNLTGAVYFPREHVRMEGNFQGSGGCTRVVASTVEVRGNPSFSTECTAPGLSSPLVPGAVRLVE